MSMKQLMGYDLDNILRIAKLQRRRKALELALPALGYVALGAAVGLGVGLMLAPAPGHRLRQDVSDRIDQFRSRMAAKGEKMVNATTQG